jgi:hypothetical protein
VQFDKGVNFSLFMTIERQAALRFSLSLSGALGNPKERTCSSVNATG